MYFSHRYLYPARSTAEKAADGAIHALGIGWAIWACLTLFAMAPHTHITPGALALYGASLCILFVASACYHMTPWEALRELLRRIDHGAIFILIAGTLTPVAMHLATPSAFAILGGLWITAVICAWAKIYFGPWPEGLSQGAYFALSALSVPLVWQIAQGGDAIVQRFILIAALFCLGMVFLNLKALRFHMAIWHALVLIATALLFDLICQIIT